MSDPLTYGLPVSISARLSGLQSLVVVSVGRTDPVKLGVSRILQGSVKVFPQKVRVTVQLMDAVNEKIVWGPRVFERPRAEVFQLETEIAREVASALGLELGREEKRRIAREPTRNAPAYGLYLSAIHQLHVLEQPQANETAEAYLLRAIEQDPGFALAYAGLAILYMSAGRADAAELAAEQALAHDADQAEAHWAMGWLHEERGEWLEARASYEAGVRFSPGSSTLLSRTARVVSWLGDFDRSIELMERALLVEPTSWVRHMYAANVHRMARDFARSIELQDAMVALEPRSADRWDTMMMRLLSYVGNDDCRLALGFADDNAERAALAPEGLSALAYVHGQCGEQSIAEDLLMRLETLAAIGRVRPAYFADWYLAMAYVGVGDNEQGLDALESSINKGVTGPPLPLAPLDPFWDPVRDHPRFIALAERINLPM